MSNADANAKKEELKRIVIKAITEEIKKPSSQEHEDVRAIAKGLEEGQELELKVITGGLCNYSYKLQFKEEEDGPVLFVKLTFGTPLLFPTVNCSPDRTKYEFKAMQMFSKISPYPEACLKPYLYFEIDGSEENMKVFAMQYSSRLEEQYGHLFMDGGIIDEGFPTKVANSLAALHNTEVTDPKFNEEIKQFTVSLLDIGRMMCSSFFAEPAGELSRTIKRAQEIGQERLEQYSQLNHEQIFLSDCYIHGDAHVFNMLIENSLKSLEKESRSTDVAIIDWEFACTGPMGKDLGYHHAFPMACAFAHTVNGDDISAKSILDYFDTLWETYSASINLDGKDFSLADLYRQILGHMGVFAKAYAGLGIHMEYLPVDKDAPEDLTRIKDSLGVLALEFIEIGFLGADEGASLEELRQRFKNVVQKELDLLSPVQERKPSRRSSVLRATGRRVSDAHSYFSMASETEASEASEDLLEDLPYFTSRNRRISCDNRISLQITDLKRASITNWDTITDFDF